MGITGFLNKKAIRGLKECLLNDINNSHPHLYKNVTAAISDLDKATLPNKKSEIKQEDDDDDDDDNDVSMKIAENIECKEKEIKTLDEFFSEYCNFKEEDIKKYQQIFAKEQQFKLEWLIDCVFDDETLKNMGIENKEHRNIILTQGKNIKLIKSKYDIKKEAAEEKKRKFYNKM